MNTTARKRRPSLAGLLVAFVLAAAVVVVILTRFAGRDAPGQLPAAITLDGMSAVFVLPGVLEDQRRLPGIHTHSSYCALFIHSLGIIQNRST